jgi:peptide chain release factor 1
MISKDKLLVLQAEYEQLKDRITDPKEMNDQRAYKKLSRKFKEMQEIITVFDKIDIYNKQLVEAQRLTITEKDTDMIELAKEECKQLESDIEIQTSLLKDLLIPKDPNDDKNAIVEIRAGTGGEEAAIFVADLYRMYSMYATIKGWKKNIITSNNSSFGGFKEIAFLLEGENVYGTMRFESGVHRVQRVPETESQGRVHTSAISVAVLPEADEIDIQIADQDLRIDIHRSQGAGGQHVNTTDSAVRITHLPTGIVVSCQDEKSQIKNRAKAMSVLRSRLLDFEIAKQEAEIAQNRKAQVGTGDRSAKIRTYNYPQSRITDHRINTTSYNLNAFLDGELDEFIESLKIAYRNERLS